MQVEYWPIERIKPYEKNARKIPQRAIDKVALSLREYGWQQPIVVDAAGVIVAGHTRRLAAIQEGMTEAPVVVASHLTPAQIKAYRLMDNRSHEDSGWELDLLSAELLEIKNLGLDLKLTGFGQTEVDSYLRSAGLTDPDAAPPAPAIPVSKPGDLWLLGEHRLLCGDATSAADVAKLLGDRKPLLMVTDPPYGIELDTEWRDRAGINKMGAAEGSYMKRRVEGHTETSISGDTVADWSPAFELVPSLQVAYVWHASAFTLEVLTGLRRIGFLHAQQIIWAKSAAALTRTHYWFKHEPCWYVRKKNAPWFGKSGANTTVWEAASPKMIMGGSEEKKFDHPTQKPIELMKIPIRNHLEAGALVYEPFGGSGTTLMAAEVLERRCCAIELDPKYVDVIVKRWQEFTGRSAHTEDGETFESVDSSRKMAAA